VESEGHERNDLGRLQTSDNFDTSVNLRYRETTPSDLFYSYSASLTTTHNWNTGWVKQQTGGSLDLNATFRSYWSVSLGADVFDRVLNDRLTRGGPLMQSPRRWSLNGSLSSNSRVPTQGDLRLGYGADEDGGWNWSVSTEFSAQPRSSLSLSLEPEYQRSRDVRQYVTQRAGGGAATFGRRYIFATIDRTTLSAEIRASVLMTPDLSLELFAQPFVSSGRYTAFGELSAARARSLRAYGSDGTTLTRAADGAWLVTDGAAAFSLGNPDFHVGSFRSNLVLRWEWRPGSTLFVVWQQDRSADLPLARAASVGGAWDALTTAGDNFLAVKLTYWLPVR